ncbi:hypothetical protein MADA3029_1150003 [Vibrio nigripulchritudo MADA3029]|uniref:Uncharacterized protein n=2 Tax=Vibrio nigripulchritudo TaxID=28173 RepID=U4JY85_9VIBR|nr:hypothetical protein VIBNIAM115_320043 [Vibrio nigripulchritudo AM115]CCN43414.1 hypothetical protein VIBNIFTn2_540046 [Vibrio nigripulchritudo FTn2]CCN48842.1 hypothetical protein VIBNIMADA3020_630003 [Vibrio nigripulchritudo MADA3020]CCN51434.1 hypothetical protein VIBNIMADA3021_1080003 [Vibrio nigripulchritudo MADA3021]CCN57617.1 hypothetical protein MADA3029_1150003 [Vibrio nigripulchritudo MADA3029]CCN67618.1 hypothetical protein VIBNIPon4_830003 [Vibrio nigripulchritudo POn4]CCN70100
MLILDMFIYYPNYSLIFEMHAKYKLLGELYIAIFINHKPLNVFTDKHLYSLVLIFETDNYQ